MSNFHMLCDQLKNKIINTLEWKELTVIQELSIPEIIAGNNAIILAPTAGGKTEAAFFPILHTINQENIRGTSIIYVSPIKALLNNQEERLKQLSSFVYGTVFKWHGDVSSYEKVKSFKNPPNILMITPESLEVILMNKKIDNDEFFKNIRFVVIDEIHSFADSERGIHLMALLERIQNYSQNDIQRIGLSATVGNPHTIGEWMQGSSKRELVIIDPPKIDTQKMIEIKFVREEEKFAEEIYKRIYGKKALFFSNSRSTAEMLKKQIEETNIDSYVHHSSVDKGFREIAEDRFKMGSNICIIATSTLELGIDIGNLDIVLQLDSPNTVSSFLQRLGRTGRRKGSIAHYVFFPTKIDKLILSIAVVNLSVKRWVEDVYVSKIAYDIMFHQIITMSLAGFGAHKDTIFNVLKSAYSFTGISRKEYESLLDFMEEKTYIQIDKNKIHISDETERVFGRQNFMELYSAFETTKEFNVRFRNRPIGTLERWFVNALGEKFQFILAGKYWQTDKIDYQKSIIHVVEAKTAMPPQWMSGEGFYSYELSQEILGIISGDEEYTFLNSYETSLLTDVRYEEKSFGIKIGKVIIEEINGVYEFHTYAGNRVNYTLAKTFSLINGMLDAKNISWKGFKLVTADKDFSLSDKEILDIMYEIKENDTYFEDVFQNLVQIVPDISLSKYQKYLPDDLRKKMVADYVYDIKQTQNFIKDVSIEIFKIYS